MEQAPALIRLDEVARRTTLSRTWITKLVARGDFPAPIFLGPKRLAFREADVVEWMNVGLERRPAPAGTAEAKDAAS